MENEGEQKQSYQKRPLWQWVALYVVIGVVIYGLFYYFVLAKGRSGYSLGQTMQSSSPKATSQPTKPSLTMQKFSDSNDFQYAYKIFPGALSSQAKQAITGFAMTTKNMPDGSTQISLTAQEPQYKNQQYMIKSGYSLYFIERMLGDDNTSENMDKNLNDDTAIIVDPQGYISQ